MEKHKKFAIASAVLIVITLTFFLATLSLNATNSNIDKYTDVKREAAERALEHDLSFYHPDVTVNFTKQRITAVEPTPAEIMKAPGLGYDCSDVGPDDRHYYSVTIQRVWLFGLIYKEQSYKMCNILG